MIRVRNLCVRAGGFTLDGVSFALETGRYGILMGKTGSGKTTILETLCGLRKPDAGSVELMGRDVTQAKPAARGVGYVPQDGALFSTMSVREHLAFALAIRHWKLRDIEARVEELARLLGIAHLLGRMPAGLSGGERQRVALGRALSFKPGILLLDEPLSALDDETREDMCALIQSVRAATGVTTLHVTHNLKEAARLADQVFFLKDSRLHEATGDELKSSLANGAAPRWLAPAGPPLTGGVA